MANLIKVSRGTALVFQDSGGDAAITLANLGVGLARCSAAYDQGAGSTAEYFEWRATFQMDATATPGETVDLYIAGSDGTLEDGDIGAADAAVAVAVLPNLNYIGSAVIQVTTLSTDFRASGICRIPSRHFSVVVHNNTADLLENTANVNTITMTPILSEVQ